MQANELLAYKGEEPYIFISYAHADSERVIPLLQALQDSGYRIWYDRGIEAGTEWSNNIAEHLSKCSAFLFFTSKNSVKSENCLDEVAYAKSHNKPALLAYLEEDVILPSGTEMQTARFQRMYINRQASIASFVENFSSASIFADCREAGVAVSAPHTAVPAAPKAEPVKATKKPINKAVIIIAAAALIVILAVIAIFALKPVLNADNPEDVPSQEVIELSNEIGDNTFRLEGEVYRMPISYSVLTDKGWTLDYGSTDSETYVGGWSTVSVTFVKDGKAIDVILYNDIENAKHLKECLVGEISVYAKTNIDFCVAAEVTQNKTLEEMTTALGVPDDRYDGSNGYTHLEWVVNDKAGIEAVFYENDAEYNSLTIKNYVLSDETTAVNEKAPKFLDEYKAPAEIGDNIASGIISLEENLYELPVPVKEFIKNGWTISSGSASVASGGTSDITLTKGESKISLKIVNLSTYKTTAQNCVAVRIAVDNDSNTSIVLPGGLSLGATNKDVKKAMPSDASVYEGMYSTTYSYSDYKDRDFYMSLAVDAESGKLDSINISNSVSGIISE